MKMIGSVKRNVWMAGALSALFVVSSLGQDSNADRVTVAFSDPNRPGTLKADVINGSIVVKGYDGKEVIIEAQSRGSRRQNRQETSQGMRRILVNSSGLKVQEENNVMDIDVNSHGGSVDLTIQVPRQTSLKLKAINNGDITVENVAGEIEANNINGDVEIRNVSGSAIAHALNGKLMVTFDSVTPNKPMSFSSLNGKIDVTFPADTKANLLIDSKRGDVYTDFDVQMNATKRTVVEEDRSKNGRYSVKIDSAFSGTINGGGPEMRFKNFNGSIYIRKKN